MSRTEFTKLENRCPERSSATYSCTLRKAKLPGETIGAVLPASELLTLTLHLYVEGPLTIVNGVNGVNILNTGRGAVTAGGVVTLTLGSADNQLVNPDAYEELHVALLQFTWNGGANSHEISFYVKNRAWIS